RPAGAPMNPLDALLPPIAPPPVSWWPPAPGWWLLALAAPLIAGGLFLLRRRRRAPGPARVDPLREAALEELASLAMPYDREAGPWLQQINALLKDRKSTRLNSSHVKISYAVFCLKKKIRDKRVAARENPLCCASRLR